MPIPTKNIDETNEEFIERCMSDEFMKEYDDNDQRLAVCYAQLEDDEERALEDINTKPTQEMADEAAQGLEWREEFGRGGTEVGVARARDIKNRVNLSIETIKRMYSYFSRHEVDKEGQGFYNGDEGYPSAGRIAWALWGGDVGFAWTKRKIEEIGKEEKFIDMKNKEIRTIDVQDLELRMDGDNPVVVGYGAVFNSMSNDLGGFREYIGSEAFEGRLEDDVRFLINHDGMPLARTTNGTLRLSVDERGLKYEAKLNPNVSTSRDLMELLKDGTINQSSFAFIVEDDSWEMKDGMNVRTINKVSRLYDVSAVTYPAYNEASSSVALRSMQEWQEKEEAKKLEESLEAEKLEGIKEEEDLKQRSLNEMRLKILKNKY
jgi:HK97 family phage prohead protease